MFLRGRVCLCAPSDDLLSHFAQWLISSGSYVQARGECPSGYQFSIPRTSRQNSILAALARAAGVKVWLNYSDRGFAGCWAVGGERCPYSDGATAYLQIVQVSLVAGVLLLMLAFAFTIFQYRQYRYTSQKRRRKQEVLAAEAQSETMTVPVCSLLMRGMSCVFHVGRPFNNDTTGMMSERCMMNLL